jgi:DNA-binding Lrp family transcriptional regulator
VRCCIRVEFRIDAGAWLEWAAGEAIAPSSRSAMVTAVILINTEPSRTAVVAVALSEIKGVSEVYSVAGNYDLVALVRVKENENLADLVGASVRGIAGVIRTETLIAFRVYSRHDLESLFSVD